MAGKLPAGEARQIEEAAEDIFAKLLKKGEKEAGKAVESELEKLLKKKPKPKPEPKPEPGKGPPVGTGTKERTSEEKKKSRQLLKFEDAYDAVQQVLNKTGVDFKALEKERLRKPGFGSTLEAITDFGDFMYGGGNEKRQLEQITAIMEKRLLPQNSTRRLVTERHRTRRGKGSGAGL